MRGCCHRPGVEVAEEGVGGCCVACCWICDDGVRMGEDTCRGVRLSLGRVMGDVVDGVAGFCTVRLLELDDERTSAVVDIVYWLSRVVLWSC
jgi:hypothetical protein